MDSMYKIGNKVNDYVYIFVKVGPCIVTTVTDFVSSDKIGQQSNKSYTEGWWSLSFLDYFDLIEWKSYE